MLTYIKPNEVFVIPNLAKPVLLFLVQHLDVRMEIIGHLFTFSTLPAPLSLFDRASDWSPAEA